MKPIERNSTRQGTLQYRKTATMGVAKGALAEILNNQIEMYNKPYVAALREYTSNALDANRQAGSTAPVVVELPTELSPNLVIRDHGVGLTEEGMEQFAQFGESTKTTDNGYIGGFGLGSKSGLAIAPRFTVSSVKDGIRNVAIVHRDEHGAPTIGWVTDPEEVDLPNGTTITIPTMELDKFEKAISKGMFIGWKPGTIDIISDSAKKLVSVHDNPNFEYIENTGWLYVGSEPKPFSANESYGLALIAGVGFPVDWSQVNSDIPHELREGLLSNSILEIPNGSDDENTGVSLLRSREGLIYNKATTRIVNEIVQRLILRGSETFQAQIDAAANFGEAYKLYLNARNKGYRTVDFFYEGEKLGKTVNMLLPEMKANTAFGFSWSRNAKTAPWMAQNSTLYWCHYNSMAGHIKRSEEAIVGTYYNHVDSEKIANRTNSVLVYGCVATASAGPTNQLKELSSVSTFFSERHRNAGIARSTLNVHFTSYHLNQLNPRWVELFDEVVSVADYQERNRLERRQKSIDNRKNRPAVEAKVSSGEILRTRTKITKQQVKVLTRVNGRTVSFEKAIDNTDLDQTKQYVILDPQNDKDIQVRRALTTKVGMTQDYGHYAAVHYLQTHEDFDIIVYNKSDRKPQGVPNVTTLAVVAEKVWSESKASLTIEDLRLVREATAQPSWVRYFEKDEWSAKLVSEETKAWFAKTNAEARTRTLSNKVIEATRLQQSISLAGLAPGAQTPTDYVKHTNYSYNDTDFYFNKYSLLVASGRYQSFSKDIMDDVVGYINMKDAQA